ncbi:MAG: polysaccharide deacetylase family protein [Chitinophagaceae bacterium]|nr:polysaccharide deacetylase family protein [Chitinophagaceae bacterium]
MKKITLSFFSAGLCLLMSCHSQLSQPDAEKAANDTTKTKEQTLTAKDNVVLADAATILSRTQVPVLCYHQIREWRSRETRLAKDVVVPPARFKSQLQILADSGYHTILPDDLYNYLTKGTALPSKPIMLTYDDGDVDQYNIAAPEMAKHGFKGVFFIMTISTGRSIYMSEDQIKKLSDDGHVIASHTWDHKDVRKYTEADWDKEITESCKQLETITGKPVKYFAYPFGVWNQQAIPELKKRNITAAFQLSTKMDETDPLYTIRRMIVPGDWSPALMIGAMKKTFKN